MAHTQQLLECRSVIDSMEHSTAVTKALSMSFSVVSVLAMVSMMLCLTPLVVKSASGGSQGIWSLTGGPTGYLDTASGPKCFLPGTWTISNWKERPQG